MQNKFFLMAFSSLLLSLSTATVSAKVSPSFDCAKARTEVEKLICSDDHLSKLDNNLNYWYDYAIELQNSTNVYTGSRIKSQNKWIKRRNKLECTPKIVDKKNCLISLYQEAIQIWKNRVLRYKVTNACGNHWQNNISVYNCDFSTLDKLLADGADFNGYDDFYGECWDGPIYFTALWTGNKDIFAYIVKHGTNLKAHIRDDCPYKQALDYVGAFQFFDEIVAINPNTNLNKWDYWNKNLTPALWVKNPQSYQNNIEKLIKYGADVNITNSNGDNVLSIIFAPEIGGKKFPFDYERTLSMLNYLIEQGVDVSHKNNQGHTALYYLQHSPYQINKEYYAKFEQLLTPQNKGEKHD